MGCSERARFYAPKEITKWGKGPVWPVSSIRWKASSVTAAAPKFEAKCQPDSTTPAKNMALLTVRRAGMDPRHRLRGRETEPVPAGWGEDPEPKLTKLGKGSAGFQDNSRRFLRKAGSGG